MERLYDGADWMKSIGKTLSPFGEEVADLLGDLFLGIYHIEDVVKKVYWGNPQFILVAFRQQEFATVDDCKLTNLVVLAHDRCIRVAIRAEGSKLLLIFHKRKREGSFSQRHPTLEDHVKRLREHYLGASPPVVPL